MACRPITRRDALLGSAAVGFSWALHGASAAAAPLTFDDLYGKIGVLGMSFSDKVKMLAGQDVTMQGFMAPPLKAEAKFFVLTEIPMALCPFCSSDVDWPDNIVVIYLDQAQTFEQANALIEVAGRLETGSWTDPETGFVSLLRIVDAHFQRA
ncbi:hypothetical protein FJV76_03195 [Mesorhizobium sp. WSM4303]|uniref:hypothetical protein n=1 Tax=unclassified Mesorhizobium TaxID=325217 RepID=UPI00115C71F4|nr:MULTISPECIES: hypothetical protein [unclassified Mesorhizobium]TRC93711.1 hypothetical protein FJV77_21485 [Mesorhizobium sp. WSM4306]TRD08541.1 hypothetical protein FJV76_03195 [Mesorhizobium sp. WSM4303]